jgi:hypothetical protein
MLEIKKTLLATGLVEDNQYLDEYVELIINNLTTPKIVGATQKHHIIPIFCYSESQSINSPVCIGRRGDYNSASDVKRRELLKLANADANNKQLHLKYSDHIKAHILLAKCGKTYNFILSNANSCMLMFNFLKVAVTHQIVPNLDSDANIQKAYNYYITKIKTKPKDDPEYYKKAIQGLKRGGADRKVRCIETNVIYNSLKEAEDANNLTRYRLNQILTGRRKQIPGMTFEYYTEVPESPEVSL